jgi:hypothetical protein
MTNEEITKKIEEINNEIHKLDIVIEEKLDKYINTKSFQEYMFLTENMPEVKLRNKLDRNKRMIMSYELSDIPKYGNVMSLNNFISSVKCGGYIDYDGSGNYIKDDKMTNITIYASDVNHNSIRKEFDKIIWFNR